MLYLDTFHQFLSMNDTYLLKINAKYTQFLNTLTHMMFSCNSHLSFKKSFFWSRFIILLISLLYVWGYQYLSIIGIVKLHSNGNCYIQYCQLLIEYWSPILISVFLKMPEVWSRDIKDLEVERPKVWSQLGDWVHDLTENPLGSFRLLLQDIFHEEGVEKHFSHLVVNGPTAWLDLIMQPFLI